MISIGILFGGSFEEHPVSVKSAREVARSLDTTRYDPHWIKITRGGDWRLCAGPDAEDGRPVVLSPDGLLVLGDGRFETIELDVAFPVLHGRLGEDGAVQGLLELSGIPYVGCDVQSSALCMDKALTYLVARGAGVATPNFWTGSPVSPTYPVFVKPARSGSSFGVTKVSAEHELPDAVEVARHYDSKVLVEEAVIGSEIGCAVLGDGEDLVVGELDRVALTHGFFRIHQEAAPETGSENSAFVVPADIPEESRARVRETAEIVYRALGCSGLARVDMFLTPDGTVVLNEVNTMPGLTSYSRYPRMMAAAGLPLGDVIDRLVSLALKGKRR
ncbi:D-alanine--D-alanine ligase family protein [Lentzea cavernae]|uniref:D-alanine--D-alanine ligase n=1 Tax=Lentzea cavernae TaxID=2020703 RepID=A0ABQ3M2M0_9PSEU|nr:D-alanine--D-alanine ligase family protein [Lentzea cavernae]GHH32050.1 putative D-alanine--D-lactate ligase [Lentzea cavernae]